jgi:hypothetical protein
MKKRREKRKKHLMTMMRIMMIGKYLKRRRKLKK